MRLVLEDEIERTIGLMDEKYEKHKDDNRTIVRGLLVSFLQELQCDVFTTSFLQFYKLHLQSTEFLRHSDFNIEELEKIIGTARLSDRDKSIAKLKYIDLLSEDSIAMQLLIDKKTVINNLPKINRELQRNAAKLYLD